MWPFIGKFVKKTLKTSVQPKINDALPSALTPFQFQTVDVGAVVSTGLFAATDGCIIISMWFTGCLCRLKVPTFVYCHLMFRRQLKTYFLRNIDRDVLKKSLDFLIMCYINLHCTCLFTYRETRTAVVYNVKWCTDQH